jgi:hypothetical protein
MGVMHRRVAGLDVHKSLPSRKRGDGGGLRAADGGSQADAGMSHFRHHDRGSVGAAGVADGVPVHAGGDGGDRGVLDAGGRRCGRSSARAISR